MATRFKGLSAFPITPADEAGQVDTEAFSALIERLDAAEVDSIGILGSTGIYMYLSRAERRRVIEAAAAVLKGKRTLMAGVGALRTDDAVALAKDVAGATGLPLAIYNNPTTTRFAFSDELLVRLAYIPNIRAIKMPLPADSDYAGELARLRPKLGQDFAIGYSGDWGCADATLAGGDTWYSVVAGLLPVPALRLMRAAQAGNAEEAKRIDAAFQPLWALFKEFGSIRVVYAAANILSLTVSEPPRPILPLTSAERQRVEEALSALETAP